MPKGVPNATFVRQIEDARNEGFLCGKDAGLAQAGHNMQKEILKMEAVVAITAILKDLTVVLNRSE